MNKLFKKLSYMLGVSAIVLFAGCSEIAPEITTLNLDRMFSPIGVEARVVNRTQAVITWTKISGAESYTIEVFENDSLTFTGDPVLTIDSITSDEIPYTITNGLVGATQYSVRIKAIGVDITDSKWSGVYFKTDTEQIMTGVSEDDTQASQVTLHWAAGGIATEIVLTSGTTEIRHTVTSDEITAGAAIVTGLTEDTNYSVRLMKDDKVRGSAKFVTRMDLTASGTIVVNPGDDLAAIIQGAASGSRIVIVTTGAANEFLPGGGTLDIDKNVIIRGYLKSNKPIIHAQFRAIDANASLTVRDVILNGSSESTLRDHLIQFTVAGINYGSFSFKDCVITNYNKSLVSGGSLAMTIASLTMENCKVSNILTNSADCIDVRSGCLQSATLSNSTFTNCAPARDFFRLDDASANFPGKSTIISVNRCSFSGVSNDAARRLLYVRFASNQITFTNNVVANSVGYYTNQAATVATYSNNDYFNAANFFLAYTGTILNVVTDMSGTQSILDPGFVDAANGDLTITNTTLLNREIGAVITW